MKNFYFIFVFAIISFASCAEDFLTQDVKGTQTLDNYFNTEGECLKQVYGLYQNLAFDDWWQIYNTYILSDMCTDDMWMNNTSQSQEDYFDLVCYKGQSTSGTLSNFWQYRYKSIHNCNVLLYFLKDNNLLEESKKTRFMAEACFLRAYFYFDLVRNFGGVPIITTMATPQDIKGIKRSSTQEVYAQIQQDFKFAIENLPLKSQTKANHQMGRATKGAAQGFLAKAYLYQEKYQEAKELLDEIILSNEYALLDDFANVWSIQYNNSDESLFEIQTLDDPNYSIGQRISVVVGSRDDSGWSWGGPTSDLENAFLQQDDQIRLFCTIIKNGAEKIPNETNQSIFPYKIDPSKHKSARVSAKLYIPVAMRPDDYEASHNKLNYRLLRYADILLMASEVENALGNDSKALEYLNQIRKRVKLNPISASGNTLRDAIRLERRLELALENNRLFDLRRWKDDNGNPIICSIMGENGSWVIYNTQISTDEYETTNLIEPQNEGFYFSPDRDLLFPIPNTEIVQSNGSIEQNPGY